LDGLFYRDVRRVVQAADRRDFPVLNSARKTGKRLNNRRRASPPLRAPFRARGGSVHSADLVVIGGRLAVPRSSGLTTDCGKPRVPASVIEAIKPQSQQCAIEGPSSSLPQRGARR
jgi:hypothetical protein